MSTLKEQEKIILQAIDDFDNIKAAIERRGISVPHGTDTKEYGALIEKIGVELPNTIILQDESGTEFVAVVTPELTPLTATENDIREGTTAANEKGLVTGTKVIPSYHTTEGKKIIQSGEEYTLIFDDELYDFTKFQAIICPLNDSIQNSVAAEKVAIDEGVYAANSTELIATVTKNSENKSINLGITNESGNLYLLRFFTYKEIH